MSCIGDVVPFVFVAVLSGLVGGGLVFYGFVSGHLKLPKVAPKSDLIIPGDSK